jgi:uncharacterized protein
METKPTFTAFAADRLIASGDIATVLRKTKQLIDGDQTAPILIFDDRTGRQVDFDLRGTADDAVSRLASHPLFIGADSGAKPKSGPGRPSLGVVCREVSLLPRHWEWLCAQPGGASATIRRLVDETRKRGGPNLRAREARDAAGAFMWVMGGNLPGFEEASRALFAADYQRLKGLVGQWPRDIRQHLARMVDEAARLTNEAAADNAGAPSRQPG